MGQDSVVSIATCYELGGPGIESQSGGGTVETGPGAYQASYTVGTGSFQGVMWSGHVANHPTPSCAKKKK